MIPIMLWTENSLGVVSNELRIDCDDFEIHEDKLCYRESRTGKGRARQDWYSKFNKFSASYTNMRNEDMEILKAIINEQVKDIILFYDNNFYKVMIMGKTHSFKPKFSSVYNENVWSGKFELEEVFGEANMSNSYIPQPITDIEDDIDPDTVIPAGYYVGGIVPQDTLATPTSGVSILEFDTELLYESYYSLVTPYTTIQGANTNVAGYVGNIFFNCGDLTSRIMDESLSSTQEVHSAASYGEGSVFLFGGGTGASIISKRVVSDESLENLSITVPALVILSYCVANDTYAYILGGFTDNTDLLRFQYSTELCVELLSQITCNNQLGSSFNSTSAGYYVKGLSLLNNTYSKQVEKLTFADESISTVVDELTYSTYYQDGINNAIAGYMLSQTDPENEIWDIDASQKFNFSDETNTLLNQELSPNTRFGATFQSGGYK